MGWEYAAIYVKFTRLNPAGRIEQELNQWGANGWEVFAPLVDGNYLIFLAKRPYGWQHYQPQIPAEPYAG